MDMDGCVLQGEVVGEARSVQCECCGIAQECTPTYIGRVRAHFHGRWGIGRAHV